MRTTNTVGAATSLAGSGFPWQALLGFAISGLGLAPRDAWAATPRELALAAGWLSVDADTPARADLEALMARFPDRAHDA